MRKPGSASGRCRRHGYVLVTDASENAALAIIRSLGSKGIPVAAGDHRIPSPGLASKYCTLRLRYPDPHRDKRAFLRFVLNLVRRERFDLIIPVTDITASIISAHKKELEEHARVAIPDFGVFVKALDKAMTVKIAQENGIPCPRTFFPEDVGDVKEVARIIRYPAVIKPRMKIAWSGNRAVMLKVTERNIAYGPEDLISKYERLVSEYAPFLVPDNLPLVQEYVPGVGCGVELLMARSDVKAFFMHRRLREYPPTGGASTLRVSIRDERLYDLGVRLLRAMEWEGVAMVEFKLDPRDGVPKLMEVNGRFWGSLPLAIASGVDFPYLLYQLMVEGDVEPPGGYEIGVVRRWLLPGDMLWLLSSLAHGGGIRCIRDFVSAFRFPCDIVSADDPSPSLAALALMFHHALDVLRGRRTLAGEIRR